MRWWLALALAGGVAGLAAARYLSSPAWLDGLVAAGAFFGVAVAVGAGMILRRFSARWLAPAAMLVALAAALTRAKLLEQALAGGWPRQVEFWGVTLASATVAWGGVALLWGAGALSEALERGDSLFDSKTRRLAYAVLAAGSVSLALFCVAPVWHLLGLRVNHWTILGLFGLASVAYAAGTAHRWWLCRRESVRRAPVGGRKGVPNSIDAK